MQYLPRQIARVWSRGRPFIRRVNYLACFPHLRPPEALSLPLLLPSKFRVIHRLGSSTSSPRSEEVDSVTFERVCDETLESLSDYFEQLIEEADHLTAADITYSSGVLTVNLGAQYGTYVINRQSPNKQIWLSSPVSGPKRYDFVPGSSRWVYKHDGVSLHELLQKEISKIIDGNVDFGNCSYSNL